MEPSCIQIVLAIFAHVLEEKELAAVRVIVVLDAVNALVEVVRVVNALGAAVALGLGLYDEVVC